MGTISHEVLVDATPADLWRVHADPRRVPEWQTGAPVVEGLEGDGASPGSSYTVRRGRLVSLGVVGRLVERALLSRREATTKLARLKVLVERGR